VAIAGELLAGRQAVNQAAPAAQRTACLEEDEGVRIADDIWPPEGDTGAGAGDPDFQSSATATPATTPQLGSIKIDATLDLNGEMPFTGKVVFDKLDYSDFLNSPAQELRRIKAKGKAPPSSGIVANADGDVLRGLIDGNAAFSGVLAKEGADAEGKPTTVREATAVVHFDELLFEQNAFKVRNQDETGRLTPVEIRYDKGVLSVPSFALGGQGVKLRLTNKTVDGADYVELTGEVDTKIAMAFVPALADASGALTLQAQAPVAFDLDKVTADVSMPRGMVAVKNLSAPVENIEFAAHFAHRVATIQKLSATFGGGVIQGGGDYKLASLAAAAPAAKPGAAENPPPAKQKLHDQMNIFLKATNIRTGLDPYLDASVRKVDLIFSSRGNGKLDISGEIDIARANFTYDIDLPTILKKLQAPRAGVAGSEVYETRAPALYFNIVVRGDRNIIFENNLAQIEFKTDLLLTGNNVETGMIGSIDVIKGHATVWNNDYTVTNATIQFIDETQIRPAFDINARTDVRDTKVFVNVSGTPDNYKVTLASDPPNSEQDIVALLTVGVSVSEFQTSGSAVSSDQALAVAAQQLLGGQLHNYTGLDLSVDNSRGVPYFKASKDVYKNVTASILRSVSDPTVGAEIEWDFARYWSLNGAWSNFAGLKDAPPSGGYGPGVGLKIEFR
jgi:hypothetical protein